MRLRELVATSDAVAGTSSRSEKVGLLADLLGRLAEDEVRPAVGFLAGEPRQGRIGVGWASLRGVAVDSAPSEADVDSAPSEAALEIGDVDLAIDRIEATTGPGSIAERREQLEGLFSRATPSEASFLYRLLGGELRQGALAGVMAEAVAKAAGVRAGEVRRALMLSGDLGLVAEVALGEGAVGLGRISLELFRPVQPMLASAAADLAEVFDGMGPAAVEWKLDGVRVQIHRSGDEVRVYTRNLNDVTDRLPDVVGVVRELPVERVVLDGEAMAASGGAPAAFQDTMSMVGRDEPAVGVRPYLFDCLHLEGRDLLDEPLEVRLRELERVAGTLRVPGALTDDRSEAEAVLAAALDAGHEGVVVKDASSAYVAGRRGKAWRKVKRAWTLDLVVLGAEWGHGRRRGWLSNLHLGARDPSGAFIMVGKTFKGLTDELLGWQTRELLAREVGREGITVVVRPELVVEVALDGAQTSSRYPGGVALRFARVRRYRTDKSPDEADTIDAVRGMLPGGA